MSTSKLLHHKCTAKIFLLKLQIQVHVVLVPSKYIPVCTCKYSHLKCHLYVIILTVYWYVRHDFDLIQTMKKYNVFYNGTEYNIMKCPKILGMFRMKTRLLRAYPPTLF